MAGKRCRNEGKSRLSPDGDGGGRRRGGSWWWGRILPRGRQTVREGFANGKFVASWWRGRIGAWREWREMTSAESGQGEWREGAVSNGDWRSGWQCAETTDQVGYQEGVVNADDGENRKVGRAWWTQKMGKNREGGESDGGEYARTRSGGEGREERGWTGENRRMEEMEVVVRQSGGGGGGLRRRRRRRRLEGCTKITSEQGRGRRRPRGGT